MHIVLSVKPKGRLNFVNFGKLVGGSLAGKTTKSNGVSWTHVNRGTICMTRDSGIDTEGFANNLRSAKMFMSASASGDRQKHYDTKAFSPDRLDAENSFSLKSVRCR